MKRAESKFLVIEARGSKRALIFFARDLSSRVATHAEGP